MTDVGVVRRRKRKVPGPQSFRPAYVPAFRPVTGRPEPVKRPHGALSYSRVFSRVGTGEARMAHVLVIGASKGIGLETTKAALAAGHRVRAFARSAASMGLSEPNLECFTGDAVDAGD